MVTDINELIAEIRRLQNEVEARWEALRQQFQYTLVGRKVRFEEGVRSLHRRYRVAILPYLADTPPRHILTAPFVYAMVVALVLLDIALLVYQQICFRAYGVPRVVRGDYIVIDRYHLGYLNGIEKLNCLYCGYANGLIAYAREVVARTEQYWCPIKHARRVPGAHERYHSFADYGDAQSWQGQLAVLREELRR
ncbi:MAG: hypothetical protein ACWGNB_07950 [Thiogranum sp.]